MTRSKKALKLLPEEIDELAVTERCERCGHLMLFHPQDDWAMGGCEFCPHKNCGGGTRPRPSTRIKVAEDTENKLINLVAL